MISLCKGPESNQRGDATYLQLSMGFALRPSMGLEGTFNSQWRSNQRGDATYLQLSMGFELRPSMGLERTWFLRGLAGRSRSTGHEEGRGDPTFCFLGEFRPAGIRALEF